MIIRIDTNKIMTIMIIVYIKETSIVQNTLLEPKFIYS